MHLINDKTELNALTSESFSLPRHKLQLNECRRIEISGSPAFFPHGKKGLEMVWWTLIVVILAIIVLLLFFYFVRTGFIQIGGLSNTIFGAPDKFAMNTTP